MEPSWARVSRLVAALVLCLWSTRASAQLGEVHGYVEPCTVENAEDWSSECTLCPASPTNTQGCAYRFTQLGYKKNCRTRGDATSWGEVWCIDKQLARKNADRLNAEARLRTRLWLGSVPLLLGAFLALRWFRARRQER